MPDDTFHTIGEAGAYKLLAERIEALGARMDEKFERLQAILEEHRKDSEQARQEIRALETRVRELEQGRAADKVKIAAAGVLVMSAISAAMSFVIQQLGS